MACGDCGHRDLQCKPAPLDHYMSCECPRLVKYPIWCLLGGSSGVNATEKTGLNGTKRRQPTCTSAPVPALLVPSCQVHHPHQSHPMPLLGHSPDASYAQHNTQCCASLHSTCATKMGFHSARSTSACWGGRGEGGTAPFCTSNRDHPYILPLARLHQ